MRQMKGRLLAALALVPLLVLPAGEAGAHTTTKGDPNDTPGPLDIRSVSLDHADSIGGVIHTIRTWTPWSSSALDIDQDRFFVLALDFDNVSPTEFDRCVFVWWETTGTDRLRAFMTDCGTASYGDAIVAKVGPGSVKITLTKTKIGASRVFYRVAAFSSWTASGACDDGCLDQAPNVGRPYLHDLAPPAFDMSIFPKLASSASTTVDPFTVQFGLTDPGHSGVDAWYLVGRPVGSTSWIDFDEGTTRGIVTAEVAGAIPGKAYEFVVSAGDRQGNDKTSVAAELVVPLDDTSSALDFFDGWEVVEAEDAFGGSYHRSLGVSSMSYQITATVSSQYLVQWVGPINGGDGFWYASASVAEADWYEDCSEAVTSDPNEPYEPRALLFQCYLEANPGETITLTITSSEAGNPGAAVDAVAITRSNIEF